MLMLLDNGSRRAAATLNLRRLARHLGERLGEVVYPISAQHSSRIPPEQLDGEPAQTLEPFMRTRAAAGQRMFGIVPLFFGPSRAISEFVPDVAGRIAAEHGPLEIRVAEPLCPLPAGEPRLAAILADNVREAMVRAEGVSATGVSAGTPTEALLVDHGSPVPAVTAVRHWLATELAERLGDAWRVSEAVMERREGAAYDFNGPLLEEALTGPIAGAERAPGAAGTSEPDQASAPSAAPRHAVLAMQFISPGRHAGDGGDIAEIAAAAQARAPGLRVHISRLIGEHPLFLDILRDRAESLAHQAPIDVPRG